MTHPGHSPTTYQQDFFGHIEYRSSKPIKAYKKWSITNIDTIIKPIEPIIRASLDLAEFRQSVQDGADEKYSYSPLLCGEPYGLRTSQRRTKSKGDPYSCYGRHPPFSHSRDTGVPDDPVFYRLALKTVGRPLCDADTTKDFILGSLAALRGHQILAEQGVLHRDMNPGNIIFGGPDCAEGWSQISNLPRWRSQTPETETVVLLHPPSLAAGQLNTKSVFLEDTVSSGTALLWLKNFYP
ncbi:uncharacterized protein F5147DRAFT_656568 [Suillus discolor]|uniref:Fungal-type protein kinase domain-containing protein n=1 Tax=Suillus discolor TaxID=1912936 RepID=A0A9P7EY05_9AGAM|nr:uncharacterized protein F5147DRAFT_656568 [Suillus discolor]KAG2096489.1 hypothetical protein F5147DRAFT_656568 [Suillus discolor]